MTPWRVRDLGVVHLRALPPRDTVADGADRVARLVADIAAGTAVFIIEARVGAQRTPLVEVALVERLPTDGKALRMSMWRNERGFHPTGARNGIRAILYPVSQRASRLRSGKPGIAAASPRRLVYAGAECSRVRSPRVGTRWSAASVRAAWEWCTRPRIASAASGSRSRPSPTPTSRRSSSSSASSAQEFALVEQSPGRRTPPATLHALAAHHLFFDLERKRPAPLVTPANVGLAAARHLTKLAGSDRAAAIAQANTAALRVCGLRSLDGFSAAERNAWEGWAPVLSMLQSNPWTRDERAALVRLVRAKAAASERDYAREFAGLPRLATALARLRP